MALSMSYSQFATAVSYVRRFQGWKDRNCTQTGAATSCMAHIRRERCVEMYGSRQVLANQFAMKSFPFFSIGS